MLFWRFYLTTNPIRQGLLLFGMFYSEGSAILGQGYVKERLTSSQRKFYGLYGDQYEVPLYRMLHDILDDDHIQWHPPFISITPTFDPVRGRPFDSEGGGGRGWHFWSGQIIYFHHVRGRKIYFRVNRGQNIYFQPQQIFEKKNIKRRKKRGSSRGGRTWFSLFCITFCRLLARNIAI